MIVTDLQRNLSKISTIITAIDQPTKQVLIEAKIVQILLKDEFDIGVEWEKLFGGTDR